MEHEGSPPADLPEDWCKNKEDYKPLIRKPGRTKKETEEMNRMAQEYRDWHRYFWVKVNSKQRYNPKIHTSEIFDEFKTGGD